MCNCQKLCRDFSECYELPKWIPASIHHPKCEDYKQERFVRVVFEGSTCTMTPEDATEFMDIVKYEDDADEYEYQDIYLTRDQFDRLPEFSGF